MSNTTYKVVLTFIVLAYLALPIVIKTGNVDPSQSSGAPPIMLFVIGITFHIGLFGFVLYAKKNGVENCHGRFAPSKIFPHVTLWVVTTSLVYPASLIGIVYVLESTQAEYLSEFDNALMIMKQTSIDEDFPADIRKQKAIRYYRSTGKQISYLDETGKKRILEPDDASKAYWKETQEILEPVNALYRFFLFSGTRVSFLV